MVPDVQRAAPLTDLVLRGGLVFGVRGESVVDVAIAAGLVSEVSPEVSNPTGAPEIDCRGCWVGPGFVDLHTHLREPGGEHREDVASGSKAAAAGGYTAVVAMPNTDPPIDSGSLVRFVREKGVAAGMVDVFPAGTLTAERAGLRPADLDGMFTDGVRMFTDDGDTVADSALLHQIMESVAAFGGIVTEHAVDPTAAKGGHMRSGRIADHHHISGISAKAEALIVRRDLDLVRKTGVQYHLQHVSTAAAVELVATAKHEALPVTAEVTPHHLAFDQSVLADEADPAYKMMPPLGTAEDMAALRSGLRSGVIDAVATDHAPHSVAEKAVPFEQAPFGVLGLADAAAVVHTALRLEPRTLFERLAVKPAAIARAEGHGQWVEPGMDANLVVFDPLAKAVVTRTHSKSQNSPYLGRAFDGSVLCTFLRGRTTYVKELSVGRGR